jgi:hypothetical protein
VGRLVLTKQEKQIIVFVMIAFLLGLTVKTCRETHSHTQPAVQVDQKAPAKPKLGDD